MVINLYETKLLLNITSSCQSLNHLAMPKNTARQRPTSSITSSLADPITSPSLSRLTVIALSTITCDDFCKPLPWLGCTVTRNNGASIKVLETSKTVTGTLLQSPGTLYQAPKFEPDEAPHCAKHHAAFERVPQQKLP
ncbi:hypothetical protein GALL_440670 [mine drainage metagenome]|uniref:Uncharacterized protein n=1 Tax=mine drainage metagenome TaxID=410659 RepID=A0A1J5PTX5_9ZZZZ